MSLSERRMIKMFDASKSVVFKRLDQFKHTCKIKHYKILSSFLILGFMGLGLTTVSINPAWGIDNGTHISGQVLSNDDGDEGGGGLADLEVYLCDYPDNYGVTDKSGNFEISNAVLSPDENNEILLCINGEEGVGKISITADQLQGVEKSKLRVGRHKPAKIEELRNSDRKNSKNGNLREVRYFDNNNGSSRVLFSDNKNSVNNNNDRNAEANKALNNENDIVVNATYPVITKVVIFHFNDAHGAIDNFAKIAHRIDEERQKNPNTFVLNAGDNFSGNPIVDQYADRGRPIFDILNAIHLDVMAMGNHDFDYGQDIFAKRMKEASFPILAANIKVTDARALVSFKPYTILKTKNGIKIGVVSAIETSNSGRPSTLEKNIVGLSFGDPISSLIDYASIKKSKKLNMLLGLTHIGAELDYKLAERMNDYDVLIGGHSHTFIHKETIINDTLISQAGSNLKFLGKVTVTFSNDKLVSKKFDMINLKNMTHEDPKVKQMINQYNNNPTLLEVIGHTDNDISGKNDLGSLISDSIVSIHNVDMAFQNSGGIRVGKMMAGDIKLKNAYELLPFGNQIVVMNLSLDEIKSLIMASYNKRKSIDLFPAGIKYTVTVNSDKTDATLDNIKVFDYNGRPLNSNKTYKVGMNDYVASDYHFNHRDHGTSTFMADNQTLIKFIRQQQNINYSGTNRASVENY